MIGFAAVCLVLCFGQTQSSTANQYIEPEYQSLIAILPGFSGYYFDKPGSNHLVIAMADTTPSDSVIRTVTRSLHRSILQRSPTFEVKRVKYSFTYLANLLASVSSRTMKVVGLNSWGLSEMRNRIVFGVANKRAETAISSIMKSARAPGRTYAFESDGGVILDTR